MSTIALRPSAVSTGEVFAALRAARATMRSCEHTALDLPGIGNSVLATKLADWDEDCLGDLTAADESLGDSLLGRGAGSTRLLSGWSTGDAPPRTQQLKLVALATAAAAVFPLGVAPLRWTATGGEIITVAAEVPAAAGTDPDDAEGTAELTSELARGSGDAVKAVRWVESVTGLPNTDIVAAAGIKPRTWHHWRSTGATPRVGTQGQLWALLHSVEVLVDQLGDDLGSWLRAGGPDRREMLRAGQHEELVAQAFREAIRRGAFSDPAAEAREAHGGAGFYDSEPATS